MAMRLSCWKKFREQWGEIEVTNVWTGPPNVREKKYEKASWITWSTTNNNNRKNKNIQTAKTNNYHLKLFHPLDTSE